MSAVRFFTDEDVYAGLAAAIRAAGQDAVSALESGRLGQSDESQLAWSSSQRRAIITFNVGHFAALHSRWLQGAQHHSGIIVSSQRAFGDVLRRLLNLAAGLSAAAMEDRLEFLGNW